MQEKQKVTLYLSPDLHRRLKVKAAMELESMSDLAERALDFYLAHADVVEEMTVYGQTHRVYDCPACASTLVIRSGDLVSVGSPSGLLGRQDPLSVEKVKVSTSSDSQGEEQLVPC
jgi:hypothetical protein